MIVTHLNKRIYLTKEEMSLRDEVVKGVHEEDNDDAIDVYEFKDPASKSDKAPKPTSADEEDIISKTIVKKKEEKLSFRDRMINWMNNNDLPLTDEMKAALAQQNDELSAEEEDDQSMQEEDIKTMLHEYGLQKEDNTDLYPDRSRSRRYYDAPQKRFVDDYVDEEETEQDDYAPLYDEMMEDNQRVQFRNQPEDDEVIYD